MDGAHQIDFFIYFKPQKKTMADIGRDAEHVKPTVAIKRCPRCHELSLDFDVKAGRIHCTRCGFEEHIPQVK